MRGETSQREARIVLTAYYAALGMRAEGIARLIGVKRDTVATYGRDYGIGIKDCKRIRTGGHTPLITSGWMADGA